MQRIRQKFTGSYHLTALVTDDDGAALTVDAPATCTILDGAGTQADTGDAQVSGGGLAYDLEVDAIPNLDTCELRWAGVVDGHPQEWRVPVEFVGDFIISVADIRGFDRAFADAAKYADAYMAACRDQIEEQLEQGGMCAFRPRGAREKVSGRGDRTLVLANPDVLGVYSVAIAGTALTADELAEIAFDGATLYRQRGWPRGFANIVVHYSYGYDSAPGPIRRAALILAKEHIVPSTSLPARATASTIGEMQYRITIAGRDGFTGIPDVDAAVDQFGRRRPMAG
jgi:hypothetical protein